MSLIMNNLECTGCDFFEEEAMYRRAGVLGKAETKEDYDRCIKTIEKRFPGKRVNIQEETRGQKADRLDTMRHNSYKRKKVAGVDNQSLKAASEQNRRYKAEGKVAPKAAPAETK